MVLSGAKLSLSATGVRSLSDSGISATTKYRPPVSSSEALSSYRPSLPVTPSTVFPPASVTVISIPA